MRCRWRVCYENAFRRIRHSWWLFHHVFSFFRSSVFACPSQCVCPALSLSQLMLLFHRRLLWSSLKVPIMYILYETCTLLLERPRVSCTSQKKSTRGSREVVISSFCVPYFCYNLFFLCEHFWFHRTKDVQNSKADRQSQTPIYTKIDSSIFSPCSTWVLHCTIKAWLATRRVHLSTIKVYNGLKKSTKSDIVKFCH